MHRKDMSKPVRLILQEGLLDPAMSFLDFGCGRGEDVRQLQNLGFQARGWDPVFYPLGDRAPADIVNLGYVVNVIECPQERDDVLRSAWDLAGKALLVSARSTLEDPGDDRMERFGDGILTRLGSFQKFYDQHELRTWVQSILEIEPIPVAPGIFLVFRDETLRETWRVQRYRTMVAVPRICNRERLFQEHRDLLERLMEFISQRGRLPQSSEFSLASGIQAHFGSFAKAFLVIRTVTGDEPWARVTALRREDILVWLALNQFHIRPTFSALPDFLQWDIRALFGTYAKACAVADQELMSIGQAEVRERAIRHAPFGKLMPKGLYIHADHVAELPTVLRLYEGCARAFVGGVSGANLIKFHRDGAQVSYLTYDDFHRNPHPELFETVVVSLDGRKIQRMSYRDKPNRFILHRKELFIPQTHPEWEKFHRLSLQEEKWKLFLDPSAIGTRAGWDKLLTAMRCRLSGHRLVRIRPADLDASPSDVGPNCVPNT
jgi:DNA phosphorothioation-associated putative methyltransferase